ncbi:MAG: T9SS type A sorting domain-containing protein [Oceanospirillaceae bacterium]|nr:T9SS type A sorting domain-containing protein [Oceanospirillaceae bacterium]
MKTYFLSLCAMLTTLSVSAQQVTNLNDSGPGSLRQAIFNASTGDTINISSSLIANGNDTIHLTSELIVNKGLTIVGPNTGGGHTLYIDANSSHRHMYVDLGTSSLKSIRLAGLAFINGYVAEENGSAILLLSVDTLRLLDCQIKNNYVGSTSVGIGGSIHGDLSYVSMSKCRFQNNGADTLNYFIAGIYIINAQVELSECEFTDNYSGNGGSGAFFYQCNVSVSDCVFTRNNSVQSFRGVLYAGVSDVVIRNTHFIANTSASFLSLSSPTSPPKSITIEDCLFQGNSSEIGYGSLSVIGAGRTKLSRNTFNRNIGDDGIVLYLQNIRGRCTIDACTFYDIGSPAGQGVIQVNTDSVTLSNSSFHRIRTSSVFYKDNTSLGRVKMSNSIISLSNGVVPTSTVAIQSRGYNIYTTAPTSGIHPTDTVNVDSLDLDLSPLGYFGGETPTIVPSISSVAYNAGNPTDFSNAQNGPIFGIREIGAAETQIVIYDTTNACGTISWWGSNYSLEGTYSDTAFNANSIDSVGVLVLSAQDTSVYDLDGTLYSAETDTNTFYQWVDCANSYAPITGATSINFLPPSNGQYAVILTNQNCVDTSGCYDYNRFSVKEHSSTSSAWLTFYPNPTEGWLTIETTGVKVDEVRVFDLSGREVFHMNTPGDALDLSMLRSGVYLVRWTDKNGEVQTNRVILQ